MGVLVQNCKTKLFFHGKDNWTQDTHVARQFSSCMLALEFVAEHQLKDVQLVLPGVQEAYDIVVPLSEDCGSGHSRREWHKTGRASR
jgi:hypothetical protein